MISPRLDRIYGAVVVGHVRIWIAAIVQAGPSELPRSDGPYVDWVVAEVGDDDFVVVLGVVVFPAVALGGSGVQYGER